MIKRGKTDRISYQGMNTYTSQCEDEYAMYVAAELLYYIYMSAQKKISRKI